MLESEGHDVVVTSNGQDCISEYNAAVNRNSHPFDVVVLDYRLPYRDGMEIAKHVLSLVPEQRILIASSYPVETITKSAESVDGCLELMLKPFDIVDFVNVVGKLKTAPLIGMRK